MKSRAAFFLKVAFGVGLFFAIFVKLDTRVVGNILKRADAVWLVAAAIVYFTALMLNAYKWRILLRALGIASRVWELFKVNLMSLFYGSVLPGGQVTGEAVKCYRITKSETRKAELVASVIMDRLTGFVASVWLGLLGLVVTSSRFSQRGALIGLLLLFSVLSAGIFLLTNVRVADWAERMAGKLTERLKIDFKQYTVKVVRTFFCFRGTAGVVWRVLGLGIIFQLLCAVCGVIIAKSIGISVSFFDMIWVTSLISLLLVIPVSVMGIGLREGGFVYFLGLIAVAPERAMGISLLNLSLVLIGAVWGGVLELRNCFGLVRRESPSRLPSDDADLFEGRKNMNLNIKKYALVILSLGLVVWIGIQSFGVSYAMQHTPLISPYIGDEQSPINGALHMLKSKSILGIRESIAQYGPIFSILTIPIIAVDFGILLISGKIANASDYIYQITYSFGGLLIMCRYLAVIFGFLGIVGFYLILRRKDSDKVMSIFWALMTSLFATEIYYFQYASQLRHWIFICALMVWQFYFWIKLHEKIERKYFYYLSVLSVFSFGISYFSILFQVAWLPLIYWWIKDRNVRALRLFGLFSGIFLIGALLFFAWNPHPLIRIFNIHESAWTLVEEGATNGMSIFPSAIPYLKIVIFNHIFLCVGFLIAAVWTALKAERQFQLLILSILAPGALLYLLLSRPSSYEPRYMLPTIICLIISFGIMVHKIYESRDRRFGGLMAVFMALLSCEVVFQVVHDVRWFYLIQSESEEKKIVRSIQDFQTKSPESAILVNQNSLLGTIHDLTSLAAYNDRCMHSNLLDYMIASSLPPSSRPIRVDYLCRDGKTSGQRDLAAYDVIITPVGQRLDANFFKERITRLWEVGRYGLHYDWKFQKLNSLMK